MNEPNKIIVPTQGGELAEQVAQFGADAATIEQQRAHALHEQGDDRRAASAQEWGAMAVGVGPTNPVTGNREVVGRTAYPVKSPVTGKTGVVQAHPQDVMDALHDRALVEDAERTDAAVQAVPVAKAGVLGRIGLGRKK